MDNKEREEMERRECEREERRETTAAHMAECQHRGRERDRMEKGEIDAKQNKKSKKGDKNKIGTKFKVNTFIHFINYNIIHMSQCVLEPPVLLADLFVLSPGYKVPPDLATMPPPFSMRGLHSRCPQRQFKCSK